MSDHLTCPLRIVLGLSLAVTVLASHAAPPVAPVRLVSETLHGVAVADPYRYFEQSKSPEVQEWLKAQAAYTRDQLDRIEIREAMQSRIDEFTAATGDAISGIVRMPGDRIYYLKRAKGERQFKLVMRTGFKGQEKVLVDPEVDSKRTGIPHAINYFRPSWDGTYLAYGMSAGGSEDASLHIVDIASGDQINEPIPRVQESLVHWAPDSKSLTFNQLKPPTPGEPETEHFLDSSVMWLKIGAPVSSARPIFGPTVTKNLGLARLDVGSVEFAPGSPWMIARTTDTTLPEGFLFVAKVSELGAPAIRWKRISGYTDQIVDIELKGDSLYLLSRKNAPRKEVLRLDLSQPDLKKAVVVAKPPEGGVIEGFNLNKDALIASIRNGTSIEPRRYANGDTDGKPIGLPFKGAASVHADPAHVYSDILYTLSGWIEMPRTFLFDGKRTVDSDLRINPALPTLPPIEVVDVVAPSHDGAKVPMTLIYKKGLTRDGKNPTLLTAYGAYGMSETASFSAARLAWLERGGILAIANVRGSGVYGDTWYRAGQKATKPNTWKDGVACAKYLIAEKYASPQTLAVSGGSAGGIFAGRTSTSAPELFAAAIYSVGVMDAVRAEESANGITNISEFGSYKNPAEFPALLEMSTYHQIKDDTAYPAVLLVHGINDPRVDVWHSAKATARLQAASTSGKPVLLRLDMQAGHGIGSTVNQRNALSADIYSFLLWQMGKAVQK
jgi:prolyl oligopeptidase